MQIKIRCTTCARQALVGHTRESMVMAIHTGLSVTIAGYLVHLERNEEIRVARIVADRIEDSFRPAGWEEAVRAAAGMLAMRARRFLGARWTVVELPRRKMTARAAGKSSSNEQ